MGMDELPEVKKEMSATRKVKARDVLIDDITKDVKADETEVEKLRKQMVKEWKLKSVLFEKEDDANKMAEEVKAGKSFEELAAKALEDKTAKSQGEGGYVKAKELLPEVAAALATMEPGAVSTVVKVSGKEEGFAIMKLEEVRYPKTLSPQRGQEGLSSVSPRTKRSKISRGKRTGKTLKRTRNF